MATADSSANPKAEADANAAEGVRPRACLEAKNVHKVVSSYQGPITILRGVQLRVDSGETVAVQGVSGSGKSTLLALLAGLDLPTRGQVLLQGKVLGELSEDQRAALRNRSVGFIFQSFHLLHSLTALENVMLPAELGGIPKARRRARELLQRVGIGDRLGHYPRHLSGGEQQRVAIARSFVCTPSLLFADEPTGNLDSLTSARVTDLLFSLHQEHGAALVIVTHDEELARRCGRRLQLEEGVLRA